MLLSDVTGVAHTYESKKLHIGEGMELVESTARATNLGDNIEDTISGQTSKLE